MEVFAIPDPSDAADVQFSFDAASHRVQITDPRLGYFNPHDSLEAQAQQFAYATAPTVVDSPAETSEELLKKFCGKFCGAACLFQKADLRRSASR